MRRAHAIALLTARPEIKEVNSKRVLRDTEEPAFVFDGCNLLDHEKRADMGFHLYRIGAPPPAD